MGVNSCSHMQSVESDEELSVSYNGENTKVMDNNEEIRVDLVILSGSKCHVINSGMASSRLIIQHVQLSRKLEECRSSKKFPQNNLEI